MTRGRESGQDDPENKERSKFFWGVGHPSKENHSTYLECLNSECESYDKPVPSGKWGNMTVGVKEAPFKNKSEQHLSRMLECPDCFSKFWFHISEEEAEVLKNQKTK